MSEGEVEYILNLMRDSILKVEERFSGIKRAEDFVSTPEGVILLDSITMRLQVIGELVKRIHKTDPSILNEYPEIEWDKIARFRDLVSHHYEDVDYEIVYDVCKNHIPRLKATVQKMLQNIS